MTKRNWIALGCLGVVAAGVLAAAAVADEPSADGPRAGARRHAARILRHRRGHRLSALKLAESLQLSDAQRQLALDKARAAAPIAEQTRRDAARILVDRASAGRDATREKLRALRAEVAGKLLPLAKEVVASLTPEQRAKIQEAAAKHGRAFDEARFERRVARMLARPMTAALLEAKLSPR